MVVDDVFSSLSGLTFDWNLMPDTESGQPVTSAHNVLRCIISRDRLWLVFCDFFNMLHTFICSSLYISSDIFYLLRLLVYVMMIKLTISSTGHSLICEILFRSFICTTRSVLSWLLLYVRLQSCLARSYCHISRMLLKQLVCTCNLNFNENPFPVNMSQGNSISVQL